MKMSLTSSLKALFLCAVLIQSAPGLAAKSLLVATSGQNGDLFRTTLSSLYASSSPQSLQGAVEDAADKIGEGWKQHLLLGAFYERSGLQELAEEAFSSALAEAPENLEVLTACLRWKYTRAEWRSSIGLADRILKLRPHALQIRMVKMMALANLGRDDEARDLMESMVRTQLSRATPDVRKVVDLLKRKDHVTAEVISKELLERSPGSVPLHLLRSSVLSAGGKTHDAIDHLKIGFGENPLNLPLSSLYTSLLLRERRLDEALFPAISVLAACIVQGQDSQQFSDILRLVTCRAQRKELESALARIDRHLPSAKVRAKVLFALGDQLDKQERLQDALWFYRRGIALVKNDCDAHIRLARFLHQRLLDSHQALLEYSRAVALADKAELASLCNEMTPVMESAVSQDRPVLVWKQ